MSKDTIFNFLISLVVAAWGLQIAGLSVNEWRVSKDIFVYLIGTMFLPAVWTLGYILFNREAARVIRWRPGRVLGLIAAPLLPAAIAFGALALTLHLDWGKSGYFAFGAASVDVGKGPWLLGAGEQMWLHFVANMVATTIFFGVVNSITAVGEEFGWRGFLQPHMIRAFGVTRGLIILGFVWGIWHLPVNLAGYNNAENPVLGALVLFPAALIAHSFILAALTIWSRSFWPAVLFHGSVNGIYGGVTSKIVLAPGVERLTIDLAILGIELGLGLIALLLIKAFWRPRVDEDGASQ
jgi:membrane protease YdiL (CAAX protease family)